MPSELIYKDECYAIQGAIFEVYREIGVGFLEAVYHECLECEMALREIPFVSQKVIELSYKGSRLKQTYQPDFVCYDKVLVELKAAKLLADEHRAQVINYLKAGKLRLGLLVNFGSYPKASVERLVV